MFAWILVGIVILSVAAYIHFTPKDVDPYFITHQASISSTKNVGETPVFRSLANEHGRVLLGSMHPLNKFSFKQLWEEADSFRILYVTKTGRVSSIRNLPTLVARVQHAIADYPPNSEIKMSFDVGIEALVAFLAVVLSGRIPRFAESTVQIGDKDAEDSADEETEEKPTLSQAEFRFAQGSSGISVQKDADTSVLIPIFDSEEDSPALQVVDMDPNADALRIGKTSVSQVDLGVAIAAQLTALGTQYRWNQADTVFVAPGPLTAYSITAMFTALSTKAQVVFAELGPMMTASTVLQRAKPTVLVTDDMSMRSLSKQVDDFPITSWARYGVRRARLARGALTKPGMTPGFTSLRLLHTATGANPYQWLDNNEMANLRILSGTQCIHVYTPDDGLPVSQTVIGDYRSGKALPGVPLGPPLAGLEIKKQGENTLLVLRANHTEWQKVNPEATQGVRLSKDGCLYIPEKRTDFSDYYYYTGELK